MKKGRKNYLIPILCIWLLALNAIANGAEIRLSVAASMSDAIKELSTAYVKEKPMVTFLPNRGSSGSLAKQIAYGAPADLFISANSKWMDFLVQQGRIKKETVRTFASNALVFAGAPRSDIKSMAAIVRLACIAIGSPKSVPAGQYAEQALRAAGIYENLLGGNKLVMAKDVRQALLYADRGEADGAFVYKTDALLVQKAVILFTVAADLHEPIEYPVGLTVAGSGNEAARDFYHFLGQPAALAILQKYGFSTLSSGAAAGH